MHNGLLVFYKETDEKHHQLFQTLHNIGDQGNRVFFFFFGRRVMVAVFQRDGTKTTDLWKTETQTGESLSANVFQ